MWIPIEIRIHAAHEYGIDAPPFSLPLTLHLFLALEDVGSPTEHALWIVSKNDPDKERARKVVSFPSDTYGGFSWQPDGKALVYAALERGRMQIFTVPVSGGTPKRVTDGQGNYLNPRVSPDGRWIAFSHMETVLTLRRTRLENDAAQGG